ncbi:MAG: CPBP family intramembrane metalloprotease [Methylacidiphilales bacterium]|nr:CPBP family intramembrane metalloprotease [Candidatus Methylacidiphilales bacterium]
MGVTAIILWIVAKICLQFANVPLLNWGWDEQEFVVGIILGLLITALSSVVYHFNSTYRRSADYYLEIVLKPLALPDIIWLGLLPGLSEELLFRGVLLPALGANDFAVIISSVCFGVLHLSGPQQWSYVIWATIVGLVLGYSAIISGNLLVPIVAHIVTNLVSSYLWKMKQL